MMRRMILMLLLTSLPGAVLAGEYSGVVKPYWWWNSLYIDISSASVTNKPACATRTVVRLAEFDPNDPVFKSKYTTLLAAWMAGRSVYLRGWDTCTTEGDEIVQVVVPG